MDEQSTIIPRLAGVEANLLYLAPMTERPHSYTYPPLGVPCSNNANAPHRVTVRDASSASLGDLVASDLIYRDRKGEIYLMQRNPKQRWYYVPETRADEVLLLKCFDSTRDVRSVLSPRGAFEDPTVPADVLPRESIELRTIALHAA
jgi:hypothetical protein